MPLSSRAIREQPRREIRTGIRLIRLLLILHCTIAATTPCLGQDSPWDPILCVEMKNGHLALEARDIPLGELLAVYRTEYQIHISGLEHREKEPVSFTPEPASPDRILRQLLSMLGEDNYLLEYEGENLKRAFVVSGGVSENQADSPPGRPLPSERDRHVQLAVILDILEGTQAEFLNLMPGDVILSYDHLPIRSARHLASEVRARSAGKQVEMHILRNERPIRFILDTGLIGIRLEDRTIPYLPIMDPFLDPETTPEGLGRN